MSPAVEMVRSEWAARAVVLSDLRRVEEWRRSSGRGDTRAQVDEAVGRFLRSIGHGAVADLWERVR